MADPTNIEYYVPSSQSSIQTAIDRVGATTKWVVLEIAPGNYNLSKTGSFATGMEYAFLLSGLSRVRIRAKGGGQVTFTFTSSTTLANSHSAFMLYNCSHVEFDGIRFVGTNEDSVALNTHPAIMLRGTTTNVSVRNCTFEYCAPVSIISDPTMSTCSFLNNTVIDAANPLTLPSASTIANNRFRNTALAADLARTHAIYIFGRGDGTVITGNHFKNITEACVKWKGNTGDLERKSMVVFSGNTADTCGTGFEAGSSTEVIHRHIHCTDNSFHNVSVAVKGFCVSDADISSNTITCDWSSPYSSHVGIQARAAGVADAGALAQAKAIRIHHNVVKNLSHFVGVVTVSGVPVAGQNIVVGSTTYTFVSGAAASATEITVGSSATAAKMTQRIADTIRGKSGANVYTFVTKNAALDDPNDVQIEASDITPQRIIINCPATFTLSTTGSNLAITTSVTDFRGGFSTGIECLFVRGLSLDHNYYKDCVQAFTLSGCIRPWVGDEHVHGWLNPSGAYPWAIQCLNNREPYYGCNRFESTPATQDTANRRAEFNDSWPVIEDQIGVQDYTSTKLKTYLMGRHGIVTAGTGIAHNYIWMGLYGVSMLGGSAGDGTTTAGVYDYVQDRPYTWRDGDTINMNDGAGHSYTCTFTRGTASDAANTFNTKASFITWVNNQTGGFFKATDTDSLSYGYVTLQFASGGVAATGTAGNSCTVNVTTASELNGVVLSSSFKGGAASGTTSVFWTPLAQAHRPCFVQADNAAGASLTSLYAPSASVVAGACYLISHSAAGGAETIKTLVA